MKNLKLLNYKGIEIGIKELDKSVWFTINDLAKIFSKDRSTIAKQIKRSTCEYSWATCEKIAQVHLENGREVKRYVAYYGLDLANVLDKKYNSKTFKEITNFLKEHFQASEAKSDDDSNDIIIYNNGSISLAVKVSPEEDTVLLTQNQIAALYETTQQNISLHIKNILEEGELSTHKNYLLVRKKNLHTVSVTEESSATQKNHLSVCEKFSHAEPVAKNYLTTHKDYLYVDNFIRKIPTLTENNKTYDMTYYNLDMILAIGYRVKSKRAMEFRRWVSKVLKQYLIKGYVIDANRATISKENFVQMENDVKSLEKRVTNIEEKMFVEPVKERLFFNGQYFDAYEFLVSLIVEAKQSITIIDPYFDIRGLKLLSHASKDVRKIVCYSSSSKLKDEDVKTFEKQCGTFEVIQKDIFHDRFIIIDNENGYQIGTSINNAGGKIFSAFRIDSNLFVKHILEAMK